MTDLPKAKGGLENPTSREDKIKTLGANLLGEIATDLAQAVKLPVAAVTDNTVKPVQTNGRIPGGVNLSEVRHEYQNEQVRVNNASLSKTNGGKTNAPNKRQSSAKSTSIWIPPQIKKGVRLLNTRVMDFEVNITYRSLIMYAYDQIKTLPDETIAEIMKPYDIDGRRKNNSGEEGL